MPSSTTLPVGSEIIYHGCIIEHCLLFRGVETWFRSLEIDIKNQNLCNLLLKSIIKIWVRYTFNGLPVINLKFTISGFQDCSSFFQVQRGYLRLPFK